MRLSERMFLQFYDPAFRLPACAGEAVVCPCFAFARADKSTQTYSLTLGAGFCPALWQFFCIGNMATADKS